MVAFKNRYLVFEIFLDPNRESGKEDEVALNQFSITKAIRDSLLVNFGEHGLASTAVYLQVKYANPITKLCIVRCLRKDYNKVWCAITLVMSIEQCPAFFNLLDLSGSIRACKNYALKYDKAKFEQYKLMRGDKLSEVGNSGTESLKAFVHESFRFLGRFKKYSKVDKAHNDVIKARK